MRRLLRKLAASTRGAAAVEFAMVLGPLLLLMIGVVEYGRLLWAREALQETAVAGARCMGMSATSCASGGAYSSTSTTTYVEGVANNWGLTLTGSNITLSNSGACAGVSAPNAFSSVTLTYTFQSVVPLSLLGMSSAANLSTTACFPNYS